MSDQGGDNEQRRQAFAAAAEDASPRARPVQSRSRESKCYSDSREARQRRKARAFCLGVRGFRQARYRSRLPLTPGSSMSARTGSSSERESRHHSASLMPHRSRYSAGWFQPYSSTPRVADGVKRSQLSRNSYQPFIPSSREPSPSCESQCGCTHGTRVTQC